MVTVWNNRQWFAALSVTPTAIPTTTLMPTAIARNEINKERSIKSDYSRKAIKYK
jgi:hypothetical protein